MELLNSIRDQLKNLGADDVSDANELILRLADGLRQRYGKLALAFVKRTPEGELRLLGLVDGAGQLRLSPPEQFHETTEHPSYPWPANHVGENWFDIDLVGLTGSPLQYVTEFHQALLIPLLVDRPKDWFVAVLKDQQTSDVDALAITANLLATALLRALDVRRLREAKAWIEGEVQEIADLQRLLQPELPIAIDGVDVAVHAETFHNAGGDYFDLPKLTHLIPEEHHVDGHDYWGAIVADVSGHGPSAAVEAAMLDAVMRTFQPPAEGAGPEHVAAYLNQYLFTRRPRASFVTTFMCNYWAAERTLRYVNAGHPPPLLWAAETNEVVELPVPADIPLRILRDYQWQRAERLMQPDDVLLVYTDGIIETRDAQEQEFGRDRLLQAMAAQSRDPQAIVDGIVAALKRHARGRSVQDDQTMIVVRFR